MERRIETTRHNIDKIFDDYEKSPTMMSHMPIRHSNGVSVLESLFGGCYNCDTVVKDEHFHGYIRNPFAGVWSASGWAWCEGCKIISPIGFSIHETETYFRIENKPYNHAGIRDGDAQVLPLKKDLE